MAALRLRDTLGLADVHTQGLECRMSTKRMILTGYRAAAVAMVLNEAQRKHGIGQGSDIEVKPAVPMPEEEPIPFAYDGVSARNARRLAKKAKRK